MNLRISNDFVIKLTVISIFTEAFLYNYVIDIKLFYLFIVLIGMLFIYLDKIRILKVQLWIFLYLFLTGVISVCLSTNELQRVFSQLSGICLVSVFFYSFFVNVDYRLNLERIFKIYCLIAFYVCLIGIFFSVVDLVVTGSFTPVKSIMLEPAHFATIIFPAYYYYYNSKDRKYIVVLSAIILSFSSLAYLALMFSFFYQNVKNLKKIVFIIALIIITFFLLYVFFPQFNIRVKDTVSALISKDLTGVNLSSFALVSNLYISFENFKQNPIFGGGIGSHIIRYLQKIDSINGAETFFQYIGLNSQDANSLGLRIFSELGIVGVFFTSFFIVRHRRGYFSLINEAIVFYFFCKILREGHYFSPEMYFFVFLYYFNSKIRNEK